VGSNSTVSIAATVTGCALNDIVLLGLPSTVCQGLSFFGHVTTGSVVEVDAVNATNGNITQSSQTYRITVIGY
jgi:carbonic anhydrase/acetyltransferase-like protein (isoleucine patch superfamily)